MSPAASFSDSNRLHSYSTFKYTVISGPTPLDLSETRRLITEKEAANRTFVSLKQKGPLTTYVINVTNTGKVTAADSVLGFLVPPGAGVKVRTMFCYCWCW